mmetsp:Transcript_27637/g.49315  ORF Transcript_27637/g.49315 Transcript_27637/m.49315 type:complete len:252 (-) Transcript_27637:125-880(-)
MSPSRGALLLLAVFFLVVHSTMGDHSALVECETTVGNFTAEVHPEWAPLGAARFLGLVESGFFDNTALYRVVPNFLVQFGIAADPQVTRRWHREGRIKDDPNLGIPVKRGTMAFAGSGRNSRTTQVWISFKDSKRLGKAPWETPFAQVTEGMGVVDRFYSGYGDMEAFGGRSPNPGLMSKMGDAYVKKAFPKISYITSCKLRSNSPHSAARRALPSGPANLRERCSQFPEESKQAECARRELRRQRNAANR